MKIAIVGYNLFGIGGTSRSNINLISELLNVESVEIVYYNTKRFTSSDISMFNKENQSLTDRLDFHHFSELLDDEPCDTYILTRENLFSLSKIIKPAFPKALIIGEVHAPVALIDSELDLSKESIDIYRVATEICKRDFSRKIGEYQGKIVVFPVSIRHIEYNINQEFQSRPSKTLFIYSRFDEIQKDISYAIRLLDYLVNYVGDKDFKLYLKGNGQGEVLYNNLKNYYHVSNNLFINEEIPEDATYLSTSRYETFGYSISEAFASGRNVLLYAGDDGVLNEIYGGFKTFGWLTKNIEDDAQAVVNFCNRQFTQEEFRHDIFKALDYSIKENYGRKFIETLIEGHSVLTYQGSITPADAYNTIYISDSSTRPGVVSQINDYLLKRIPIYRKILVNGKAVGKINRYLKRQSQMLDFGLNVREDFVFVESFHGKSFAGDPKYIALALKEQFPELNIYVSSVNQLVDIEVLGQGLYPVRLGSALYFRKFQQSKYVITNGNALDRGGKQDGQIFIQTWHGFPLKKMVNDLENDAQRREESEAFLPRMLKWDYLLSSSSFNTTLLSSSFRLEKNTELQILEYGCPRNDYLIRNKNNSQEFLRLHEKYFNRPYKGKIYVLFCPTWRKNAREETTELDLAALASELPENYEIIVKLHPKEGKLRSKYSGLHPRIHCFYNELVDIQELYLLSSVLITDFSSAMFDFAHLHRKILILQEDAEMYSKEIGWYFDTEELIDIKGQNYSEEELLEEILKPVDGFYNKLIINELMNQDHVTSTEEVISEIICKKNEVLTCQS